MKKTMVLTLLLIGLLLPPATLAVDPSPTPRSRQEFRLEKRQEINDFRAETKEKREELRATITQVRITMAQERKTFWSQLRLNQVKLIANRIVAELQTRYNIIQKLKTKIADRITAKSATHDTSAASAKLALFSDAQYQADLKALQDQVSAITSTADPKTLLASIQKNAQTVRKDLRDLHQFLVEVMKLVATAPKK